jgi:HD-like signal output (HDOD) protein
MAKPDIQLRIEKKLKGRSKLATLVGVVRKVERIVSDRDASAHELSDVIGADAVLTAKILQVVNSAGVAMGRRIGTVDEAVVILGFERIRSICAGLMSGDVTAATNVGDISMSELWCHAVATSAGVDQLHRRFLKETGQKEASTAGLLCNIGRIMIFEWFAEESVLIVELMRKTGMTMIDAEKKVLGATHAEIGFWASQYWEFDEMVSNIIRHHHGPVSSPATDLVNLCYVCAQAKLAGSPGEPRITHLLPGLFGRLGLDETSLDEVLKELDGVYASLTPVFEMMRQ